MRASADDYAWFLEDEHGLTVEGCITLLRGVTSDEVIGRLGAGVDGRTRGLPVDDEPFVAVTDAAGGVVLVEHHSGLGVDHDVVGRLSAGIDVAALWVTEVNENVFLWAKDGVVLVEFDMFRAGWREGAEPDALLGALQEIGFGLDADDEGYDEAGPQRALALAEHVTGIRLTAEMLEQADFVMLRAPGL